MPCASPGLPWPTQGAYPRLPALAGPHRHTLHGLRTRRRKAAAGLERQERLGERLGVETTRGSRDSLPDDRVAHLTATLVAGVLTTTQVGFPATITPSTSTLAARVSPSFASLPATRACENNRRDIPQTRDLLVWFSDRRCSTGLPRILPSHVDQRALSPRWSDRVPNPLGTAPPKTSQTRPCLPLNHGTVFGPKAEAGRISPAQTTYYGEQVVLDGCNSLDPLFSGLPVVQIAQYFLLGVICPEIIARARPLRPIPRVSSFCLLRVFPRVWGRPKPSVRVATGTRDADNLNPSAESSSLIGTKSISCVC